MIVRRVFAVVLAVLFFVPELPAKDKSDWNKVEQMKNGAEVRVVLWSGKQFVGEFKSADERMLTVAVFPNPDERIGSLRKFKRETVRVVYRAPLSPHDPGKVMVTGARIGGATGAIVGAATSGSAWPLGAFSCGLVGAAAGGIVAGVGGAIRALSHGRPKTIYESTHRPSSAEWRQPAAQE